MKLRRNSVGELCALQAEVALHPRAGHWADRRKAGYRCRFGFTAYYRGVSSCSFHHVITILPSVLCLKMDKDAVYLVVNTIIK